MWKIFICSCISELIGIMKKRWKMLDKYLTPSPKDLWWSWRQEETSALRMENPVIYGKILFSLDKLQMTHKVWLVTIVNFVPIFKCLLD